MLRNQGLLRGLRVSNRLSLPVQRMESGLKLRVGSIIEMLVSLRQNSVEVQAKAHDVVPTPNGVGIPLNPILEE